MKHPTSNIVFTPAIKALQEQYGSRKSYERMEWAEKITPDLEKFISERDSFYISTASADGQPYIQHRGGSKGFLKVLDEHTLAFADFSGNAQYISMGNLSENDKVCLFLMDYAGRRRIKIWGTAKIINDDPELLERLTDLDYPGRSQRVFRIRVKAWDVNCPQHISPRGKMEEVFS